MCLYLGDGKKLKINILDKVFKLIKPSVFILRGYTPVSSLGVTPEDSEGKNLSLIADAINNDGKKIYMDIDNIVLSGPSVKITRDIFIASDQNNRCTITRESTNTLFSITSSVKNIRIENLDVINPIIGTSSKIFYNDCDPLADGSLQIDNFIVNNCYFKNISLYRQSDRKIYEGIDISYIKNFEFVENTVQTVYVTFCEMVDTAFENVKIQNNRINNFYYTLFNFGITNLPDGATSEQINVHDTLRDIETKNMLVDNNRVVNTFDWIHTKVSSSLYYAFILTEGGKLTYTNNYVEGLKASINIALYDFYANCPYVRSEGNVWKNNICFADDHDNCTLMKAKGGNGHKIFCNNKYIIEQKYVNKLISKYGATQAGLWVDIISITDNAEWEVYNNTIDLAVRLKLFRSSISATKVDMSNNSISALTFEGALTARLPNHEAYWTFNNNILTSIGNEFGYVYLMTAASDSAGTTLISNNTFNIPYQGFYGKMITDNSANASYTVKDNKFIVSAFRAMTMATFTNNTIIGYNHYSSNLAFNAISDIIGVSKGGEIIKTQQMQFILDTSEYGRDTTPLLFYLPEDRIVDCDIKLIHTVNDVATRCHVQFSTTSDGVLTIKDITDENNIIVVYHGAIRPDNKMSNYFCSRLFRVTLQVPGDENASSYIQVKGEPGIFDVDFVCEQSEFEEV